MINIWILFIQRQLNILLIIIIIVIIYSNKNETILEHKNMEIGHFLINAEKQLYNKMIHIHFTNIYNTIISLLIK